MKNRMVNTKFWSDTYIANLDPLEKLLFLYFITNPYTNICGIYEIPLKQIALDTGIDRENLEKVLLPRFKKAAKVYYIQGWVYIKNFLKHQKASGNVQAGIENGMGQVPSEIMAKIREVLDTPPTQGRHSPKLELESELELKPKVYVAKATDWILKEEVEKCITDKRRHVQVIGVWIKHTGLAPENMEQLSSIIKRYSKPALLLKGYSNEDIETTIETLKNTDYLKKYTIETVLKFIDKVVANKVKRGPRILKWERIKNDKGQEVMRPVYANA